MSKDIEEIARAMESDPFIDNYRFRGETRQRQRCRHYAAIAYSVMEKRLGELNLLVEESLFHLRIDERAQIYHHKALAALNNESKPVENGHG